MKCIKRSVLAGLVLLTTGGLYSQNLYFNIGAGIMNYGGDLQDKPFTFSEANPALSIGATYRLSNRISVWAAYTRGKIAASDAKNHPRTNFRNLSFYTNISEGSLVLQGDLFAISETTRFTPYGFAGIAMFHFNPYAYDTSLNKVYLQPLGTEGQGLPQFPDRKMYKLTQFGIPFGAGIKYAISNNLVIGAEVSFRNLFTDYLDDASMDSYVDTGILRAERGPVTAKFSFRGDELPEPVTFALDTKRGNPDRKDTYYTCLIKLSFAFGNIGFGGNGYSRKLRKQTGCPTKVL